MLGLGLQEIILLALGFVCCLAVAGGLGAAFFILTRRQRPPDG